MASNVDNVKVEISVVLGRSVIPMHQLLRMGRGAVIELDTNQDDPVTILANDALKPEEIDVDRAEEQLVRGNKEWSEAGDSEEAYTEALHRIAEAEAKLATAAEKR